MPLEPRIAAGFTRDYYNGTVVVFANDVETAAATARSESADAVSTASLARTVADNALFEARVRYTLPAGGIPVADLAAAVAVLLLNAPGSANNFVTDPAAARPPLPIVWWKTGATRPTNGRAGDVLVADTGALSFF
jgi:hypothetical protein